MLTRDWFLKNIQFFVGNVHWFVFVRDVVVGSVALRFLHVSVLL